MEGIYDIDFILEGSQGKIAVLGTGPFSCSPALIKSDNSLTWIKGFPGLVGDSCVLALIWSISVPRFETIHRQVGWNWLASAESS